MATVTQPPLIDDGYLRLTKLCANYQSFSMSFNYLSASKEVLLKCHQYDIHRMREIQEGLRRFLFLLEFTEYAMIPLAAKYGVKLLLVDRNIASCSKLQRSASDGMLLLADVCAELWREVELAKEDPSLEARTPRKPRWSHRKRRLGFLFGLPKRIGVMFRGRLITRTPPPCSSPPLVPARLLRSSSKPPIPVSAGHSELSMTMDRFSMQQMKDHIKSIASTMEQRFKTKKKIKDEMELRWLNRLRKRKLVNYA